MSRYDPDDALTVVGAWASSGTPSPVPVGHQVPLGGRNVITQVVRTGLPTRIDNLGEDAGLGVSAVLAAGVRSAIGVPISVEGRRGASSAWRPGTGSRCRRIPRRG